MLKTTHVCDLVESLGQESGPGLTEPSALRTPLRHCQAGVLSANSAKEGSIWKLIYVGANRILLP